MAIEMTVPMVQFNKRAIPDGEQDFSWVQEDSAVSYTHLALPTKRIV